MLLKPHIPGKLLKKTAQAFWAANIILLDSDKLTKY